MRAIQHVSDTALWVAVHRAREGLRSDPLYQDPLSFRLAGERGDAIAKRMSGESFMDWMMAMRTVAIDTLIQTAIKEGVTRVINLGAGLDTRPYRMDLPESLEWIEVDFPGVIDHKELVLENDTPRVLLKRVKLDLADRSKFQSFVRQMATNSEQTLIITEGVIPYLDPGDVARLAEDLYSVSNFKYWLHDYRDGGYASGIPKWWIKWRMRNAPFKFDVTDWFGFFAAQGWKVKIKIPLLEESKRRGRAIPGAMWLGFLSFLIPEQRMEEYLSRLGVAMFEKI